ncbi:MAG: hypothetical protein JXB50_00070 [Spirochaetes bacterium]|nr:hypothetical protein [Spirochaetota bacterium]
MKIFKKINVFLFLLILLSCNKDKKNDESYYNAQLKVKKNNENSVNLPVDNKIIEGYLGSSFVLINFLIVNLDSDIENELAIAYKKNDSSNISIAIFDLLNSGLIKKNFNYDSEIFDANSFSMASYNLFRQDDIAIVIEGKSKENKFLLNIFSYFDTEADKFYKLVGEFYGDYSVIIDFKEVENDRGKYHILKDVVTIENSFSYANTNIQQKSEYIWDYDNLEFKLAGTGQILSTNNKIDNIEDLLGYINGYWYPEYYAKLLNQEEKLINFDQSSIEFISFSPYFKEVNIKYDDYMAKYNILKTYKFWSNRPGISLNVESIQKSSNKNYIKIDVVLVEADKILVKGPGTFEEMNYIRFPKSFIEIINDKKNEKIEKEKKRIKNYLNDTFVLMKKNKDEKEKKEDVFINFDNNNRFFIKRGNEKEEGCYIIIKDNLGFIISFLFNQSSNILNSRYYLIDESNEKKVLYLTPVKINYNSFTIDDFKKIAFVKGEIDADKSN